MVTLFQHLKRKDAETWGLVLDAVGIGHRVVADESGFRIDVPEAYTEAALNAICRYRSENKPPPAGLGRKSDSSIDVSFSGVWVALLILTIHIAVMTSSAPGDYNRVFGADAGRIMSGEWYRCITALLLHAGIPHLISNMAGIILFGGAVCAVTGTGAGWLMILGTGFLGNFINAWVNQPAHLSIGASTAIFGALGLLCAIQAVDAFRTGKGRKQVILILGAGVALLAFLGAGPQSDLGAHLFGCFTGIFVGGLYALKIRYAPKETFQILYLIVAMIIIVLSWIRGAAGKSLF